MRIEDAIKEIKAVHLADQIHEATEWIGHIQAISIDLLMDDGSHKMMMPGLDLEIDILKLLRKNALEEAGIQDEEA